MKGLKEYIFLAPFFYLCFFEKINLKLKGIQEFCV